VPLKLGCDLQASRVSEVCPGERLTQEQAADYGGRGGTETTAGRDVIQAGYLGPKLGTFGLGERPGHGDSDHVLAVSAQDAGAVPGHVDMPLIGKLSLKAVVQVERESEAIESRAEVG